MITHRIAEAVTEARGLFDIKDFPGNFFEILNNDDCIEKHKILLFKEDIGKLSGFIGYGENGFAVICINYKRSLGHQNFTLAHEIGHWIMHKGQNISDVDKTMYSKQRYEEEASKFAAEFLYPEKLFVQDYFEIVQKGLLQSGSRKELAEYIDVLCQKYCLSFEMVLRNILYKNRQGTNYGNIKKEIEKALGGKISEVFERDFYLANEELPEYQRLRKPYEELAKRIDKLEASNKISKATAEAIKLRNGIEFD